MTRRRTIIAACCILCAVVWLVFVNSLQNGFVWDDDLYTSKNPIYQNFDIGKIFTTLANGQEYLPVRDLSYAIDHAIGHGHPAVFHLSNLLIYTLTVLMVFGYARITSRLLQAEVVGSDRRSTIIGVITALQFAVHPIHSEVVNFITCRNALLSTLLFFVAGYLFLQSVSEYQSRRKRLAAYSAALFIFLLSIFAKANSIILSTILILHILYLRRDRQQMRVIATFPFFAVSIGSFFLMIRIAAKTTIITDRIEDWTFNGCITKIVKALQIILFYLWKLVFPYGYSASYDTFFAWSPATPSVIAILIGLGVLLYSAFRVRTTYPYFHFSLCWYLLALIPVLNFFTTTPVVADRYAFLPSFAFFFVIACSGMQISEKIKPAVAIIVLIILLGYWGGIAFYRNQVWYSDETLWIDTIRVSPTNFKGYRNLGSLYLKRGNYDTAMNYLYPIADQDPCYYYLLGFTAYQSGDLPLAKQYLIKSLGRNFSYIPALFYLGMIYDTLGEPEKASELFTQTLRSHETDEYAFKEQAEEHLKRIRAVSGNTQGVTN